MCLRMFVCKFVHYIIIYRLHHEWWEMMRERRNQEICINMLSSRPSSANRKEPPSDVSRNLGATWPENAFSCFQASVHVCFLLNLRMKHMPPHLWIKSHVCKYSYTMPNNWRAYKSHLNADRATACMISFSSRFCLTGEAQSSGNQRGGGKHTSSQGSHSGVC